MENQENKDIYHGENQILKIIVAKLNWHSNAFVSQ